LIIDDSRHKASISLGALLFCVILVTTWPSPGRAGNMSCRATLGTPAVTAGPIRIQGVASVSARLTVAPRQTYLIEVDERDSDIVLDVFDSKEQELAHASHPERRSATTRALLTAPDDGTLVVRATGREHTDAIGSVSIRAFDVSRLQGRADCSTVFTTLAQADAEYAQGKDLAQGRGTRTLSPRDTFLDAASKYTDVERALGLPDERELRGQTALALAGLEYLDLHAYPEAVTWAKVAETALDRLDLYRHARAEALIAQSWMEIGKAAGPGRPEGVSPEQLLNRAIAKLDELSRFHLQRKEFYDSAFALNNIAITEFYQGRYLPCIAAAKRASNEFRKVHETLRGAQSMEAVSVCMWGAGRLLEALPISEHVLEEIGPDAYPLTYLGTLDNTAAMNLALGRLDEALNLYNRELATAEKNQSDLHRGMAFYGIGITYYALGKGSEAREYIEEALPLVDARNHLTALRALANIDADEGDLDNAIKNDREALGAAVSPSLKGRVRIQLAAHMAAAGKLSEAKAELDDVLKLASQNDPNLGAEARLARARVLRQMNHPAEAVSDLQTALPQLRRFGRVAQEFDADLELARVERLTGQPDASLKSVSEALKLADAVRLQTANPELRAQLQTPLRPAYELKVELLRARYDEAVAAGKDREAREFALAGFLTADGSRARTLGDVAAQEYSPGVRNALKAELAHREQLYRRLAALQSTLDARLDKGSNDPVAKQLIADIAELNRQLDLVNTEIARRTQSSGPAERARGKPPALPADTALVSYWLGEESAYAWVLAHGQLQWIRLDPSSAIEDKAKKFYDSLTRFADLGPEQRLTGARALYDLILRPLEATLSDAHQWLIVPDGMLDYIPVGALRRPVLHGDEFVAVQHDIAYTPAAWMLGTAPVRNDGHGMLMVADPVYQPRDPRLPPGVRAPPGAQPGHPADGDYHDLQRLPFTAREAAQIAALVAPQEEVDALIGLDANRENLLRREWSKYRFIHIAAHGIVDAQSPQLSSLVLSQYDASGARIDGAVRLADISVRNISAEVAVFSACQTAVGKRVPSEGLVGIASTVLARGARAVVASLWQASDEMSARLMTEFYRHLLRDSMSPAAALGESMRSVIGQDPAADPALWATFQVAVVALGSGLPTRNAATAELTKTH
jgi:CHAT domain-containing protein